MGARRICAALMIGGVFTACGATEEGSEDSGLENIGERATEGSAVESEAVSSAEDEEGAASRMANLAAMHESRDEALAVLKRVSDFLADQKQFRTRAVMGFGVLQETGQMLEFGGERTATVRRPDRLRFEGRNRDGEERTVLFDGTRITMFFPNEKAYASVERPGDLDQALDYMIDELNAPLPIADLFYEDLYSNVAQKVELGLVVGDSLIGGVSATISRSRARTWTCRCGSRRANAPFRRASSSRTSSRREVRNSGPRCSSGSSTRRRPTAFSPSRHPRAPSGCRPG